LFLYFVGGQPLKSYETLARTVIINPKNHLVSYDDSLKLIGTGRSAFVFRITSSRKVMKIFFPSFTYIAKEESEIYRILEDISYFPKMYDFGSNYIVIDFIDGQTLFECLIQGTLITSNHLKEVDYALSLAVDQGLNPSDIHLRNIIITNHGAIKLIDVARFRQTKDCNQWRNLKKSYDRIYCNRFFPKKIPASCLNTIAFLYKKGLLPFYRE